MKVRLKESQYKVLLKEDRITYLRNQNVVSDKDVEEVFNKDIALKEKGIALEKEYFGKLKAVIPMKKIALLHQAEREFKREMLRNLKEGRERRQMMQEKTE